MALGFFVDNREGKVRIVRLADFNGKGDVVELGADASPWGIGGWIAVNGNAINQLSDPITKPYTELSNVQQDKLTNNKFGKL